MGSSAFAMSLQAREANVTLNAMMSTALMSVTVTDILLVRGLYAHQACSIAWLFYMY